MPSNWKIAEDYDYFAQLDATGLAWECLRRNPDYRNAFPELKKGKGAAREWGLRFRNRSQTQRLGSFGSLDSERGTRRCLNIGASAARALRFLCRHTQIFNLA